MFWHEKSDGRLKKCWQLSSVSHLMLRALLFRLQWQKTTYLYTLLLPLEVLPSTPWPTPSVRRWMGRWTMETATGVTAARDDRPCQLCEWHFFSVCVRKEKQGEKKKTLLACFFHLDRNTSSRCRQKTTSVPTQNALKWFNTWHEIRQKPCQRDNK